MTGIIWACAATFIAACVPILGKVGTKKTDPALAGSIAGIVLCASIFFYEMCIRDSFHISLLLYYLCFSF